MADETPPMDDTRLAEIREYLDYPSVRFDEAMLMLNRLVPSLLAEVDRLRAREAAAMAIVRDVATLAPIVAWGSPYREICGACGGHRTLDEFGEPIDGAPIEHQPGCVVARALLAQE